jgi:hypothetical protein
MNLRGDENVMGYCTTKGFRGQEKATREGGRLEKMAVSLTSIGDAGGVDLDDGEI